MSGHAFEALPKLYYDLAHVEHQSEALELVHQWGTAFGKTLPTPSSPRVDLRVGSYKIELPVGDHWLIVEIGVGPINRFAIYAVGLGSPKFGRTFTWKASPPLLDLARAASDFDKIWFYEVS